MNLIIFLSMCLIKIVRVNLAELTSNIKLNDLKINLRQAKVITLAEFSRVI